jgi:uncharacterized repeat protein (TIGR03803 family)
MTRPCPLSASPWNFVKSLSLFSNCPLWAGPRLLAILALLLPRIAAAAPVYERLNAFEAGPLHPEAKLIQHTDGTFFGTTSDGGGYQLGTVFQMNADGTIAKTIEFTGNGEKNKGANPFAALIRHSNGNYYGTTGAGGQSDNGTIFQLTPAGELTTILQFTGKTGAAKGSSPVGALIEGTDGNLWGTTFSGGADDSGTIFKVTPAGDLTTVFEFLESDTFHRGSGPAAALTEATVSDGHFFYGTTSAGGLNDLGTVFRIKPTGEHLTLVHFTGNGIQNKGADPQAKLYRHTDGKFYGTTLKGGLNDRGTIFWMNSNGTLATMVHMSAADGPLSNGSGPWELALGADGNFYGTTRGGGTTGNGTFFRVTPSTNFSTRFSFSGTDGSTPVAGLVLGTDGNFYGSTRLGGPGGTQGSGTIFRITPAGVLTTIRAFTGDGTTKGNGLNGGLVADGQGGFLGTTFGGGAFGVGTVFRRNADGTITTLVEFTGKEGAKKGTNPAAGLFKHSDGNFYGTTRAGGASDNGTVFKLTPAGEFTTLVEFTGTAGLKKGAGPAAPLVSGLDGALYGTTERGGAGGFGTLFRLTTDGTFLTRVEFTGVSGAKRGTTPSGALLQNADGSFSGTTALGGDPQLDDLGEPQVPNGSGTVFRLTVAGDFTSPVLFTGKTGSKPGAIPLGGLMRAGAGLTYGTSSQGGANGLGTIFRLNAAGEFTNVYDFKLIDALKGSNPNGKLVEAPDGTFYGVAGSGNGSVFRFKLPADVTTVFQFTGSTGAFPGEDPNGDLLLHTDGHLYGTTFSGGVTGSGTPAGGGQIFRLRLGPAPVTLAASLISASGATLNGTINPNGTATTAAFEYGTDPLLATSTVVSAGTTSTGGSPENVSAAITGLTEGTTYYFRVTGVNAENTQTQRGAILSFVALAPAGQEAWRQRWFGTTENTGDGADSADPDNDGVVNLIEYGFDLNPTSASSGANLLPQPQLTGENLVITFTRPAGATGIVYGAEWSVSVLPGTDWTPIDNSGVAPQYIFSVPAGSNERTFVRLKVSVD